MGTSLTDLGGLGVSVVPSSTPSYWKQAGPLTDKMMESARNISSLCSISRSRVARSIGIMPEARHDVDDVRTLITIGQVTIN
ncbi:hypothetical protein AB1N83_012875 [Pleurotus pulmonarius]